MKPEHKELLLKDLCARLPYRVKISVNNNIESLQGINVLDNVVEYGSFLSSNIEEVKPYLFPLSSMTEEQEKEIQEITGNPDYACIIRKTDGLELWLNFIDTDPTISLDAIFEVQDYLNKNHFDYRGLIPMRLAIDATNLNIY